MELRMFVAPEMTSLVYYHRFVPMFCFIAAVEAA